MSNLSEIIDRLERVGQSEGAHALRHVRDVAEQRQADLVAKDDRIRDYMNICEDLSRKLEEARMRIGELDAQVIFHKEIADAREFDFHQAEKRITAAGEALAFYADAETYHAIAFLPDYPCGEFIDDFSEDHGDEHYDRPMPGKRARDCIRSIFIGEEGKSPNAETATGDATAPETPGAITQAKTD